MQKFNKKEFFEANIQPQNSSIFKTEKSSIKAIN